MFDKPHDNSTLDRAIADVFAQMVYQSPDSDEYAKMVETVSKLYSLKEIDKPKRVNPDTIATILANLVGIVLIVRHEHFNVLTSKALSFVMKPR